MNKLKPIWLSIKSALAPVALSTAQAIVKALLNTANETFLQWTLKYTAKVAVESSGNKLKKDLIDKIEKGLK